MPHFSVADIQISLLFEENMYILSKSGLEFNFLDNKPFGLVDINFTNQVIKFITQ